MFAMTLSFLISHGHLQFQKKKMFSGIIVLSYSLSIHLYKFVCVCMCGYFCTQVTLIAIVFRQDRSG